MKVLVAGPFVGEFGWELFCWQPMVRSAWLKRRPDRTIVYTRPGRNRLYAFADEVRTLDGVPDHEPECLAWHDFTDDKKRQLNEVVQRMVATVKAELKEGDQLHAFTLAALKSWNVESYDLGSPDPLRGESYLANLQGLPYDPYKPVIALCVRDRAMSEFRNWEPANWYELAEALTGLGHNVIFVGTTRTEFSLPAGVPSFLNSTTIDDLIGLFSHDVVLAVGGTSGIMHLASRCGCAHLVWGWGECVERYAATNWFGANCKVRDDWGYDPNPQDVAAVVDKYLKTGAWE